MQRRIRPSLLSIPSAVMLIVALCIGGSVSAGAAPEPGPLGSLGSLSPGSLHFDLGGGADPIVTPVAADPTIVRASDGTYYLYATSDRWMDGDGMHHLPIFSSEDLIDWTYQGDVFAGVPGWAQDAGGGLWAPDVNLVGGQYVLYYSVGNADDPELGTTNPCIGRAVSASPTGPFTDMGGPVFCADEVGVEGTIDPDVVYDGAATVMFVGNFDGVYAITLNAGGTAVAGDPEDNPVKVAGDGYEAPFIQHHGDFYYMYVSAGNCCNGALSDYRVYVGRSQKLTGPYTDSHGVRLMDGGGDLLLSGNVSWLGPGHNTVVTDDAGDDWIIYHAAPTSAPKLDGGPQNRQGMIDQITWAGGWPHVGDGTPTSTAPAVPYIAGQQDDHGPAGSPSSMQYGYRTLHGLVNAKLGG